MKTHFVLMEFICFKLGSLIGMNLLLYDNILKTMDLPTIPWRQYFSDTNLDDKILWSVKVEEIPSQKEDQTANEHKHTWSSLFSSFKRKEQQPRKLIGAEAAKASEFAMSCRKKLQTKRQQLIYYPYYTVVKSGILDINRNRIVIEGTKGDVFNLVKRNQVETTMIFTDEDVEITGDEQFLGQEEVLALIDYGREIQRMSAKDLDLGKNLQLYFSYVYETNTALQPVGKLRLIFYHFKLF